MMFAGIFAERVSPYNPLDIDFAGILSRPVVGALGRHRRLRARHPLAHHLRLAHRAGDRLHLVVHRLDHRRGPRRRVGLFRRQDRRLDPALRRYPARLPDHRAGAGRGRGAAQVRRRRHRREPDLRDRDPDRAARRARGARRRALDPRHALCRCGARRRLFQQPHHLPPHGAERRRALPHHVHRLHRAGDPARSLALLPRPRRHRADAGLGPDAVRQCGGLLSRGAVDDPVPGRGDQPRGVRLQPVRRLACATISIRASRPERLRASLPATKGRIFS